VKQQSAVRTAAAGLIGNVLEWFDYAAYGFFASEIGRHFTPASMEQYHKDLITFLVFWSGFLARPVGGIVLGMVGDRIGRKALLSISIVIMGAATLVIGCLPGYEAIGIAAPILLTLMRMLQGFSLGGEFTGSMVYTTELASPLARGIIASSTAAGTSLGFILGLGAAWTINKSVGYEVAAEWGWRIPFIASMFFVLIGYYLRRGIHESEHGQKAAAQGARIVGFRGFLRALAEVLKSLAGDWKPIVQTFGIVATTNAAYYLTFTFAVEKRKHEDTLFQAITIGTLVIVLFFKVFGGWWSDRVGRRKLMLVLTFLLVAGAYPAIDFMLHGSPAIFFLGQIMLAIPLAMALGLQGAMVVEIFPLKTRVTSMSFAYSITLALAGGIAPMVATWLIKQTNWAQAPALFVIGYGLIGLPILFSMKETNTNELDQ
jgi:MFS transporter, MHS family, proline/betaine transporter